MSLTTPDIPRAPSRLPQFLAQIGWPLDAAQLPETMTDKPWLDGYDHYDRTLCLFHARDAARSAGLALADSLPWDAAISASFDRYGRNQVIAHGSVNGWHSYSGGAARLYLETKEPDALEVVRLLTPTLTAAKLDDWFRDVSSSREVAFMLRNGIAAEKCGLGPVPTLDHLADVTLDHLGQWSTPAETRPWAVWCKPFMVSLSCLALIEYADLYPLTRDRVAYPVGLGDPWPPDRIANLAEIPEAIAAALDRLWADLWLPTHDLWPHGAFRYQDLPPDALTTLGPFAVREGSDRRRPIGPAELSAVDGYYDNAILTYTSGPAKGQSFRVTSYDGARRAFLLNSEAEGGPAPLAGDTFTLDSSIDRDSDTNPAPDLNHLISPAYAWMYSRTGEAKWRERHDAIFNGGTMSWRTPTTQKAWNESWYAGSDGLTWRAAGVEADAHSGPPEPVPPQPEPVPTVSELLAEIADLKGRADKLPAPRAFITTIPPTVKSRKVRHDIDRDGKVTARWDEPGGDEA